MIDTEETLKTRIVSAFVRALKLGQVDRGVVYAFLARVVSIPMGPVTMLLVGLYMTPEAQGFYYTFLSLIALQSFVDLGFSVVIAPFVAQEWAKLDLDEDGAVVGDSGALSRLIAF